MTRLFLVLFVLAGLGTSISFSQKPTPQAAQRSRLESYIQSLRAHSMNHVAAGFSQICGVQLDEAAVRFAFSNNDAGTWKLVDDLPKAYDGVEMDLVGAAEVWKNPAGTIVETWQAELDVGGFGRTFFCFDNNGRLAAIDSVIFQIPTDDS